MAGCECQDPFHLDDGQAPECYRRPHGVLLPFSTKPAPVTASVECRLWIKAPRGPLGDFAARLLHAVTGSSEPPRYQEVQRIYEDDGRGTIRDYVLGTFTEGAIVLEVIFDRVTLTPINFRMAGDAVLLEQIPFRPDTPLRLIGESTNRYRLKAPASTARRLVSTIVLELDGYKTDADLRDDPARVEQILEGRDPLMQGR